MEHRGHRATPPEFDDEAGVFHGEVADLRDVVTFQARDVDELRKAFRESVDDYLAFCAERGEEPDKPYSGQFVTRIPPELHREASRAASQSGQSLNAWVTDQLRAALERGGCVAAKSKSKKTKASGGAGRRSSGRSPARRS